jgi:hypothetical protein
MDLHDSHHLSSCFTSTASLVLEREREERERERERESSHHLSTCFTSTCHAWLTKTLVWVGASLARAIDMPDMIAYTLLEYEEKAVELGVDAGKRSEMRARLAAKRLTAPLFDTARWVRAFEHSLDTIWDRYQQNLAPCDVFPHDVGNMHQVRVHDPQSNKKWKEEKGDALCTEMQVKPCITRLFNS